MNRYRIFKRRWWRPNAAYPNGREPYAGRKLTLRYTSTLDEARRRGSDEGRRRARLPRHERGGVRTKRGVRLASGAAYQWLVRLNLSLKNG